jgi:hypothetical protein
MVVDNIEEVLGTKYMHIKRDHCFKYDNNLGSYVQTTDMLSLNSLFETTIDVSSVQDGGVVQVTMHRNSYQSISSSS